MLHLPIPITLVLAKDRPFEATEQHPSERKIRTLIASGGRVEIIAESPSLEEWTHIDPSGALVHRICPERAYGLRWLPRHRRAAALRTFEVRALEKMVELRSLWNRRIARIEVASGGPFPLMKLAGANGSVPSRASPSWPEPRSASLICATYNRLDEPMMSIPSLLDCAYEARRAGIGCEVLVVHQNADTANRLLAARPEWRGHVRFIYSDPGLPRARNVGARYASGDLLIFVDDDVILEPGFVLEHVRAATASPTCAGTAGRVMSRVEAMFAPGDRPPSHPSDVDPSHELAVGQIRWLGHVDTHFDSRVESPVLVPHTPLGANMAFKRSAMQTLFGDTWFDDRLEGSAHREETTLSVELIRRGGFLVFAPRAGLYHFESTLGGCQNRGDHTFRQLVGHASLDSLFYHRLYRHCGIAHTALVAQAQARDIRREPGALRKLKIGYVRASGLLHGRRRFHEMDRLALTPARAPENPTARAASISSRS